MGQASVARDSELLGCPSGTWWNWWREAPQRSRGAVPKRGKQQKSPWGQTTMGGPEKVPGSGRCGWNLELSNAAQGIWLEKRRLDNCLERSAAWEKRLILRLQQADVRPRRGLPAPGARGDSHGERCPKWNGLQQCGLGVPCAKDCPGAWGCRWGPCPGVDRWQKDGWWRVVAGGPHNFCELRPPTAQ